MMRILVCGDRNWSDKEAILRELAPLSISEPSVTIIHGCAKGADTLAGEIARQLGMQVVEFPADWKTYGKAAGPIRNQQMIDEGKPDLVMAFHPNIKASKGTADMVRRSLKHEITTLVFNK